MDRKTELKDILLKQRALLEALINQNEKYFNKDAVSGLEFSKYLENIQKAYDNFLFEKIIRLHAIIPGEFEFLSINELIADTKFKSDFMIKIHNNPSIGTMVIGDKEKRKEFIEAYDYDAYYQLEVIIRSILEYTKKNGLVFPSRIVHPKNGAISIGLSDDSFTILESIDKLKMRYTNTLGRLEWTTINPDYSEDIIFVDDDDLLNMYLSSIRLDDNVLPSKMSNDIKEARLIREKKL